MNKKEEFDYSYERYAADQFLEWFTYELNNNFDTSADEQIKNLKADKNKVLEKYDTILKEEIKEDGFPESHYELFQEADFIDSQIVAMNEMKIIYAYKLFEINVKRLLKPFYDVPNGLYKWENLKGFFKGKGILFSELKGYNELDELRQVNNNLKHSGEVDTDVLRIKEFTEEGEYDYNELDAFYQRVKQSPFIFLQDLANAINKERYSFDEEKIETIAHDLAKRMDAKDAEILIKKLNSKY